MDLVHILHMESSDCSAQKYSQYLLHYIAGEILKFSIKLKFGQVFRTGMKRVLKDILTMKGRHWQQVFFDNFELHLNIFEIRVQNFTDAKITS